MSVRRRTLLPEMAQEWRQKIPDLRLLNGDGGGGLMV
jgi:hypothetical protein